MTANIRRLDDRAAAAEAELARVQETASGRTSIDAVELGGAAFTQGKWLAVIGRARSVIYILAMMFDNEAVAEALASARSVRPNLSVRIVISGMDNNGTCRNQQACLQRLRQCGAEIRLLGGRRQHAKVCIADRALILGSCNFTQASQHNNERNIYIPHMPDALYQSETDAFNQVFHSSAEFVGSVGVSIPATPDPPPQRSQAVERARSAMGGRAQRLAKFRRSALRGSTSTSSLPGVPSDSRASGGAV